MNIGNLFGVLWAEHYFRRRKKEVAGPRATVTVFVPLLNLLKGVNSSKLEGLDLAGVSSVERGDLNLIRTIFRVFLICLTAFCIAAQEPAVPLYPEWKITLQVIDETGQPVEGAHAQVGFSVLGVPGEPIPMEQVVGRTDANGLFVASGRALHRLFCSAQKSGYYMTALTHNLNALFDKPRHEPWNPTLQLVLKRVVRPTSMYAKRVNLGIPVFGKPIAFDLMAGDWSAPYGKGNTTDMIFTARLEKRGERDFDYALTVSFPNIGDGIQEFTAPVLPDKEGSELQSPHQAPPNGYQSEWVKTLSQRPGEPAKNWIDKRLNFFFRVQTVLDDKGNVKSALYGKIYGDFMNFTYYLNPTPNSRNVEFDPKQNLLKKLKSTERVDAP